MHTSNNLLTFFLKKKKGRVRRSQSQEEPRIRNAQFSFIDEEMKVVNTKTITVRGNIDSYLERQNF